MLEYLPFTSIYFVILGINRKVILINRITLFNSHLVSGMKKDNFHTNDDPLIEIDQIENIEIKLTNQELIIINNIFSNIGDFQQLIDNIEQVILNDVVDERVLLSFVDNRLRKTIKRIFKEKRINNPEKGNKRSLLFRLIFELPELIKER